MKNSDHQSEKLPESVKFLCLIATTTMFAFLVSTLVFSERASTNLAVLAYSKLPDSGVENPITAVLLNFRSFDTLLEIAVLFLVVIVAASDRNSTIENFNASFKATEPKENRLLNSMTTWLVPLIVVLAGYVLWTGAYRPGGAFQAGSLLAGLGVLVGAKYLDRVNLQKRIYRVLTTLGLSVFIAVGLLVIPFTGGFLLYPKEYSSLLILFIETAATISIAFVLTLLYLAIESMPCNQKTQS